MTKTVKIKCLNNKQEVSVIFVCYDQNREDQMS